MRVVFWISAAVVAYTYFGYLLYLYLRSRWKAKPTRYASVYPRVSIVVAAYNAAELVERKLQNLSRLNYPRELLEVIIVSDGSTDRTEEVLHSRSWSFLHPIVLAAREGKSAALNHGIEAAKGEILVFTDVRQVLVPDAIRHLVSNFADETVGCVSGELMLGHASRAEHDDVSELEPSGLGVYWTLEQKMRRWEGASGSVVGTLGALYAVRSELAAPFPCAIILDDLYMAMNVARRGFRIVYEPRARVWDDIANPLHKEFWRKVRTLTGNYQLLQLAPWLMTRENPIRLEFISHKLMRLLVPFAFVGMLISSALVRSTFFHILFWLQLGFYGMSIVAIFRPRLGIFARAAEVALTLVVLNTAAIVALIRFVSGRREAWAR
jgi:cellulose synthase/poly-beta-1,6-N-acetylglucosamine synthase-like glycosyltransferase